ncbi:hypothetical protein KEF29_31490 [Streptomyces tuirus]|uniref:Uncharacterized protein n=1 Tax=Streptomyces tuirus TaxID=68278 RepID=A0A941FL53_9ACTN|nr:hypothetical protein [Streptomyces tuirus]
MSRPLCARCTAPALLVVRYPHTWRNSSGAPVDGLRESVLCGSCDADDPAAEGLLALLTEDGAPPARLVDLVGDWLTAVRHRTPDHTDLAAEEARWRAGDL